MRRRKADRVGGYIFHVTKPGEGGRLVVGQTFNFAANAITIGPHGFKPIEVLEAAATWWENKKRRGWKLIDLSGKEIKTDGIEMRMH